MSTKDQMHHVAAAIATLNQKIDLIETTRYTTTNNREELKRLKRARRALEHDLEQLAASLPHPVNFNFFHMIDAPAADQERSANDPFDVKGQLRDYPSNLSADARPALSSDES